MDDSRVRNLMPALEARVDTDRVGDALDAADCLATNFVENGGRYVIEERWGPEGVLYRGDSAVAMLDAYRFTGESDYLKAVRAILEELERIQKPSGGWSIDLGESGEGFEVTESERERSRQSVDPPTTAAILKAIAEYDAITGDHRFREMGDRAFKYVYDGWDPDLGKFVRTRTEEVEQLRSASDSYHLFYLLAVHAWRKHEPEAIEAIYPSLVDSVRTTYEDYDEEAMPLFVGLHSAILSKHCTRAYVEDVIKPTIDDLLVKNDVFALESVPGGYGHHDGSRGIVTDEAHMRSACGVAIAMKQYDLVTGSDTYRSTEPYRHVAEWIDGMKSDGKCYYEYESLPERRSIGLGTNGQYLPCWWILGTLAA